MIDNFDYKLVRSLRSRSIRITIYPNGEVKVSAPHLVPEFVVRNFVNRKSDWIDKKLKHFEKRPMSKLKIFLNSLKKKDYLEQKDLALKLVTERLNYYNRHYNVKYNKISIRNQKSRWGSCSHRGNLNFSYKIVFLPKEAQDYIVVHELCHIIELNHSHRFWKLVAEMVPDYARVRGSLR